MIPEAAVEENGRMEISDEAVDAAIEGAHPLIFEWLTLPYGASVSDYPDRDDLRAADEAAEKANNELLRAIFRAGLEAAAPHIASVWHDAVSEAYVDGALGADQANVMYNKNPYRSAT